MDPAQGHAKFVWLVALVIAFSVASLVSFNDAATQNESLTFGLGLLASAFLIPLLLSTIVVGAVWLIAQAFPGKRWTGATWINLWALFTLALTVFFSVIGPWMKPFLERESAKALNPVAAATPQVVPEGVLGAMTDNQAVAQIMKDLTSPSPAPPHKFSHLLLVNPGGQGSLWYDPGTVEFVENNMVRVNIGLGDREDASFLFKPISFNCKDGSISFKNNKVTQPADSPVHVLKTTLCARHPEFITP